jgi:methyl-accepting chemotaxis protein
MEEHPSRQVVPVSEWFGKQVFTIGIIGGGRGGLGLLKFFGDSSVARVVYIVDPNSTAPGIVAARQRNIRCFGDDEEAMRNELPDFLFDCTGDADLETRIRARLRGTSTMFITPITSRMMVEVLSENSSRLRDDISEVVSTIKNDLASSLDASNSIVSRINSIMSNMQMLALNASIEASKAGVHGRGFTVVADHLGKSVEAVRNLTQEINLVNQNIIQVSHRSDSVLEKLK